MMLHLVCVGAQHPQASSFITPTPSHFLSLALAFSVIINNSTVKSVPGLGCHWTVLLYAISLSPVGADKEYLQSPKFRSSRVSFSPRALRRRRQGLSKYPMEQDRKSQNVIGYHLGSKTCVCLFRHRIKESVNRGKMSPQVLNVFYYESIKREIQRRPIYECRCEKD